MYRYTTREIRPGFWSAEAHGIKRFGTTEANAIGTCRRAIPPGTPHDPPEPKPPKPRIPRQIRIPAQSEPIPPVNKSVPCARYQGDVPTITPAIVTNAKYTANVRSVCPYETHADVCACQGLQVQRPNGTWTPSMKRPDTLRFCRLHGWEWKLVPRTA